MHFNKLKKQKIVHYILLGVTVVLLSLLFILPSLWIIILFPLFIFYIFVFVTVVEENLFVQKISVKEVTEGDWLAEDVIHNNKIICSKKKPCLDNKQIKNLKKHNIRKVWIKIGIPFVPAIFIGFLITIILYLI